MINMDLESTIVTISNLLKLDFENSFSDFIQPQKQIMSIPDYQREYKWEKSKIKIFVDNVMQRSKFLGIFTVEVPEFKFFVSCRWSATTNYYYPDVGTVI